MENKLEKILLVNDDAEDIVAMQARLPDEVEVLGASQWQARCMGNYDGINLIVLDNDANDLKESKGKETLEVIRKKSQDVPVIYTSFQPGWVAPEVYQRKNVEVVKTDQILEHLAQRFGLELKPAKQDGQRDAKEPQLTILVSYNPVSGYEPGVYGEGKLLVVSFGTYANCRAKEVLGKHITGIYKDFEWRKDRDLVKNVFVYDGINGGDVPGHVAAALGHDIRMKVNLLACHCQWDRKTNYADSMYVNLFQVGCGGSHELGAVADIVMGLKRPNVDYEELFSGNGKWKIPMSAVTKPAERFRINY